MTPVSEARARIVATRPHARATNTAPTLAQLRSHPHILRSIAKTNQGAALMRDERLSLSAAARAVNQDVRTFRQNLDTYDALHRDERGRYHAGHMVGAPLPQQFLYEAPDGAVRQVQVFVSDMGAVRLVATYWSAMSLYENGRGTQMQEGLRRLQRFEGRSIVDVFGNRWTFVSDRRRIDHWLRQGDVVTEPIQSP